jgi:RNA polymerase primary sigma factor
VKNFAGARLKRMSASMSHLCVSARARIASNQVASTSYNTKTSSRPTRALRVTNAADDFRKSKNSSSSLPGRSARHSGAVGDNSFNSSGSGKINTKKISHSSTAAFKSKGASMRVLGRAISIPRGDSAGASMDLDIGGDVADLDIDALLSRVNELHAASEAMNVLPTQKELDQLENTLEKDSDTETMRGVKQPKRRSTATTTTSSRTSRSKKRDDEELLLMSDDDYDDDEDLDLDDDDEEDLDDEIEVKGSLGVEIASIEAELEKKITKETIKGKKGKGEDSVLPKTRRVIKSAASVRTERAMRIARGVRSQRNSSSTKKAIKIANQKAAELDEVSERVRASDKIVGKMQEARLAKRKTKPSSRTGRSRVMNPRGTLQQSSQSQPQVDSMKVYLKEIGSVSLLNANQEVQLARKIQDLMNLETTYKELVAKVAEGNDPIAQTHGGKVTKSMWARELGLTEPELEMRLTEGKNAKNHMIQANLRLVVSIAKRYANRNMSFQDLIQEGCVGLIRGAEKFDFERGYKFSTYAHWWIRQAVTRSISDQSRTIRLPVHLFEIISRMNKLEQKFIVQNGREATLEEISKMMEMPESKITQIKKAAMAPVSLAQAVGADDDKRTVEDTLVDNITEHPEESSGKVLLKEDLENVLNTLNPRERDVLRLRYGLDDGRVKTLEEIGNVFSVTRERIRQIEAKALRKLRQPSRNGILRDYIPPASAAALGFEASEEDEGDERVSSLSNRQPSPR